MIEEHELPEDRSDQLEDKVKPEQSDKMLKNTCAT